MLNKLCKQFELTILKVVIKKVYNMDYRKMDNLLCFETTFF